MFRLTPLTPLSIKFIILFWLLFVLLFCMPLNTSGSFCLVLYTVHTSPTIWSTAVEDSPRQVLVRIRVGSQFVFARPTSLCRPGQVIFIFHAKQEEPGCLRLLTVRLSSDSVPVVIFIYYILWEGHYYLFTYFGARITPLSICLFYFQLPHISLFYCFQPLSFSTPFLLKLIIIICIILFLTIVNRHYDSRPQIGPCKFA